MISPRPVDEVEHHTFEGFCPRCTAHRQGEEQVAYNYRSFCDDCRADMWEKADSRAVDEADRHRLYLSYCAEFERKEK